MAEEDRPSFYSSMRPRRKLMWDKMQMVLDDPNASKKRKAAARRVQEGLTALEQNKHKPVNKLSPKRPPKSDSETDQKLKASGVASLNVSEHSRNSDPRDESEHATNPKTKPASKNESTDWKLVEAELERLDPPECFDPYIAIPVGLCISVLGEAVGILFFGYSSGQGVVTGIAAGALVYIEGRRRQNEYYRLQDIAVERATKSEPN